MTVHTANPSNVVSLIKSAAPGDRVQLLDGAYEPLTLSKIDKATPGVLIEPAPGADPLIPGCEATNSAGLTLDRLRFGMATRVNRCVTLTTCSRMALTRLLVDGCQTEIGPDNGVGIRVRESQNVLVRGCDITRVAHGVSMILAEHLEVDRNTIHHLYGETDAIRGTASNVRITNNFGHSFYPFGTWHVDFIQFWTADLTEPLHDIHIEGNEFRQEDGATSQGVFCGNEDDLPYERLVIRDNCISGSSYNGILAELAPGAVLDLNVVVGWTDTVDSSGNVKTPFVALRRNTDGAITENVAPNIKTIDSVNVEMTDNLVIPLVAHGDYSIADQWRERREENMGGGDGEGCCGRVERAAFRRLMLRRGARRILYDWPGDLAPADTAQETG